ncbi:MAG: anti-sigma F factor antagonist [Ruminococcaceae bacterium]|nr:anti-sigma F factor antagonist [Oscillospiraceae bacterium]
MHFNFVIKKNTLIVKIVGELDHHSAGELREQLDSKIITEGISNLVFDLSDLVFMDSSGIGVIIGRYKLIKSLGGEVYIVSTSKNVDKLLSLSGIPDIIKVTKTYEETE